MIARFGSMLLCDYETFVSRVLTSASLHYIAKPLLSFNPTDPKEFPQKWVNGEYSVQIKLFGVIPLGNQMIRIELIEKGKDQEYIIRDNGSSKLIPKWDHWIFISKTNDPNIIRYLDRVEIKAGLMTPIIWLFAHIFYRWRQYRWKKLVQTSFEELDSV